MTHSAQTASKTFLFFLLCLLLLTACGGRRLTPTALALTHTPVPVTSTPAASRTPAPTLTASLRPTQTLEPGVELTNTPVPVTTPQSSAEDYRLKAWDYSTARQMYAEADSVPIAEEYADLRSFYQLSLLEELYLSFPNLNSDPDLLRDMANLKGLGKTSYWATYGLLHDHAVEPVRQGLEQALNNGSIKPSDLTLWGKTIFTESEYSKAVKTTQLFDGVTPATVLKVSAVMGWDFFVLRENGDGSYTVFALYPEWKPYWWNDETFQITDLNGNGREEIAITYEGWGTGSSNFCEERLFLYEWDGQAFRDLMTTPLNVLTNTDGGSCLGISFLPDAAGQKLIRAGTSIYTYCEDYPYLEPVTYRWSDKGFAPLASTTPVPPEPRQPDKCTIGWALAAGVKNDSALKLLAAAVADWPADADDVWGPAAHDYFKMKLATWYIRRGQIQRGVELLKQVRDAPTTPEFQLASQVAATFIETYETKGVYQASRAVSELYAEAEKPVCGMVGCNVEEMRKQWGFAEIEGEWNGGYFHDDFWSIDGLSLDLNRKPPVSLEAFQKRLKEIGKAPAWVGEADADGQGQPDWLVEMNGSLIVFLRQNGQLTRVNLDSIYVRDEGENKTYRWEIFRPDSTAPVINVYQSGTEIFAFHLLRDKGTYQVVIDLDSPKISSSYYGSDQIEVQDWSVVDGKLMVQYKGSQGVYVWDASAGKLVPTGYAPDLMEENIALAEKAIYFDNDPAQAITILSHLLKGRVEETYAWMSGGDYTNPPRVRPYAEYLLGLAYERNGDLEQAARAYWQLWHDFPSSPYSLVAQSKLEYK